MMKSEFNFGIIIIIGGVLIILHPTLYGFQVSKMLGVVIILLGVFYAIRTSILKDKAKNSESNIEYAKYVICIECKTPFANNIITEGKCPQCGGELENLEGFYDRHPELKNNAG
jgi:membrane-bound ClpP family serine protease